MSTDMIEPKNVEKKPFVLPQPSLSKEEFAERLAEIRRRRNDPDYIAYIERTFDGADEVRRQINEQERQWLDEQEDK